ncbi:MAG: gephyrin-like molybdotransferase Glp [Bryobacteraceae bacterium]
MATLHFRAARQCVLDRVSAALAVPTVELVPLDAACGRVLAEVIHADRDYPPLARSLRDGFAVRSEDLPGRLRIVGEVRAGDVSLRELERGEAFEIMTGAPVPPGADAVVMIEHAPRDGEWIAAPSAPPGQFIAPPASEARAGDSLLDAGRRLGPSQVALLAAIGRAVVRVYRQPRVAILSTGDEIVEVSAPPLAHQVRDSNAHSLAAQLRRAGALPEILPPARDTLESIRVIVERGLAADLLLVSGGVSAGKYDLVERVLADLGAEFFFDRVLIRPGQPLVFGRARERFFFGLPGNPASTLVTFEVFARAAVELLSGEIEPRLPFALAQLTADLSHKPGLTRFLPARLSAGGAQVTPLAWRGSSDIPALARADAFLVARPDREIWKAGDLIEVLTI